MSSFEVGGVGVGAGIIGGTIAVGAALAVLTPVAAGYGLYKIGENIKDELVRVHQEALEKQFKEQTKAKTRVEKAKVTRGAIIEKCKKCITELQESSADQTDDIIKLAKTLIYELTMIQNEKSADIDSLEMLNRRDEQRIAELMSRYKKQRKLIISNASNDVKIFFDSIDALFVSLETDDYSFADNIGIQTENQVKMRKLHERGLKLIEEFNVIFSREVNRVENCPVQAPYVDRIAVLFRNMREEITALQKEDEEWAIESRLNSLDKEIKSYYTYKTLLDKEQEKFLMLYLRYKKSCEETGEEYKEAVEFDSYSELEHEVSYRMKQLERMRKCADLYEKLGRDAYICFAFEKELNKLNYSAEKKEISEQLLHRKLQYLQINDRKTPFFQLDTGSVTRIFRVNDDVALQLIIHADGTSTMETVSINHKEDNNIIEAQKEHCMKSKLLEKSLRDNWFITAEFDEEMSAEMISFEFNTFDKRDIGEKSSLQKRNELARKEQRRRNAQKAKARSMALHY